eukprot:gene20873-27714_t
MRHVDIHSCPVSAAEQPGTAFDGLIRNQSALTDAKAHRRQQRTIGPFSVEVRLGGVWSDQHHSQASNDMAAKKTVAGGSVGLSASKPENKAKRLEACDWILSITGKSIPYEHDLEFRSSLRDGVLLCHIINAVCPGTIQRIHEADRSDAPHTTENVKNFLQALASIGVPPSCTFTASDLELESNIDRARVVDSVLWLKRLHEGVSPLAPFTPFSPPITAMEEDDVKPYRDSLHMDAMKRLPSFGSPIQPAAGAPKSRGAVSARGFEFNRHLSPRVGPVVPHRYEQHGKNSHGVAQLMQQCTAMLEEKMVVSSSVTTTTTTKSSSNSQGGEFNFEAVGPVLESVLGNLTQEYERRLLTKDQEIISTKEKMAGLARQMVELQNQITCMRQELVSQQEEAAANVNTHSSEQAVAELRAREEQLLSMKYGVEEEAGAVEARSQAMAVELEEMREQLSGAGHLEGQYHAVQEENRKLYNMVQDLKGSIRDSSHGCLNCDVDGDELAIYEQGKSGRKLFKFDRVFDSNSTQEAVYGDAKQLIRSVLDGYNVCIFAYGQTGAGKTHTMSGTNVNDEEGRGINYRALDDLFNLREKRSEEVEYCIRVQMLEIYNETLRDLLSDDQSTSGNRLDILNTQASGCNVPNAIQLEVRCPDDVVSMMQRGARNRHSAETRMNERSSRSHQILTVIVDGFNKSTHARSHGCLHLVDLAGSERVSKSDASGDRLTEAQYINKSSLAVGGGRSMAARLAGAQANPVRNSADRTLATHCPGTARNSKLTQLLADSLSGNSKVRPCAALEPSRQAATSQQQHTRIHDESIRECSRLAMQLEIDALKVCLHDPSQSPQVQAVTSADPPASARAKPSIYVPGAASTRACPSNSHKPRPRPPRPQAPSVTRQLSMRTSGVHSSVGMTSIPIMRTSASGSQKPATAPLVPQSAGGRRMGGGWKS